MFLVLFFACATNVTGVCVYTTDQDNAMEEEFVKTDVCSDYKSKLGCRNAEGEFTKGALASEECVSLGYPDYCETEEVYVKNESECPQSEEETLP